MWLRSGQVGLQGGEFVAIEASESDAHEESSGLLVAVLLAGNDGAVVLYGKTGDGIDDAGPVLAGQSEDERRMVTCLV